jgi:hypothetical protein
MAEAKPVRRSALPTTREMVLHLIHPQLHFVVCSFSRPTHYGSAIVCSLPAPRVFFLVVPLVPERMRLSLPRAWARAGRVMGATQLLMRIASYHKVNSHVWERHVWHSRVSFLPIVKLCCCPLTGASFAPEADCRSWRCC